MRIKEGIGLDFKDVLIVPQRSSLDSRIQVQLTRTFKFRHSQRELQCLPVIAANMDTTGSFEMAKKLASFQMLTALHKHYTVAELVDFFNNNKDIWQYVFYTIGANDKDLEKLQEVIIELKTADFPRMICLDAANGYTQNFVEHLKKIRLKFPDAIIMAGNVVTGNMTEELILSGADIVKVGIGGGSLCLTRLKTGVGFPQLSAVNECSYYAHGLNAHVCSDGGIQMAGDVCKALCGGGDFVMIGGLFMGYDENSGKKENDTLQIHGMSSKRAMELHYGQMASYRTSEGRETSVKLKGSIEPMLRDVCGGVASCCTYIGCSKIKDMPKCAEFTRVNNTYNRMFDNGNQ